jgi:hypothetical protein
MFLDIALVAFGGLTGVAISTLRHYYSRFNARGYHAAEWRRIR